MNGIYLPARKFSHQLKLDDAYLLHYNGISLSSLQTHKDCTGDLWKVTKLLVDRSNNFQNMFTLNTLIIYMFSYYIYIYENAEALIYRDKKMNI